MPAIGIIGGSGVYEIEGISVKKTLAIKTPFGKTSDKIVIADVAGKEVAFLPRHGKGHFYSPSTVPVKANVWALKSIGVRKVIAISAVGSLKKEIAPQHFVVPNQIIDRTKSRPSSFFEEGVVGHVGFADPFCQELSDFLYNTIHEINVVPVHREITYLCMEGPQFSTRAESNLYRSWGAGIIGMTALPEAKLLREAEICYGMIALSTDYDCWHEEDVTIEMVVKNMSANVANIKKILPELIRRLDINDCVCEKAAAFAIMTDKKIIPSKTKKKLALLYEKYWK